MSFRYVRDTLRQWATAQFVCPFYDSINLEIGPPHDGVWSTVQFDPSTDLLTTYCGGRVSIGLADFVFGGPPNKGDGDVLAAAEASIEKLLRVVDPTGALVLAYAHQPEEFSNGSADHNYRVFIAVEYRHYWTQPILPALPATP